MRQKISVFLIYILLVSCSSDNSLSPICKLLSVKVKVLFHEDLSITSAYNPNFSGKLNFEYDNQNKLTMVKGGVLVPPPGQFLTNWYYDDSVVDLVTYSSDTIKVHYNSTNLASTNKKAFKLDNSGRLLYKKETKGNIINEYNYAYNGNTILETRNGYEYRTYTMSNGNLVSIEQFYRSGIGNAITGKKQFLFLNYDATENLLKGKYYIDGAFFNGFSNNNYQRFEMNQYSYNNGTYTQTSNYYATFPLTYSSDNVADVFEKSCAQ